MLFYAGAVDNPGGRDIMALWW